MNGTTYKTRTFGHRLGNWTRRMLTKLNGFEIGVAQRAQRIIPGVGYTLTRIAFLLLKLAILALLLFISIYALAFVLVLIVFTVIVSLFNRPTPVEIMNWQDEDENNRVYYDDIHKWEHQALYPEHPIYDDE